MQSASDSTQDPLNLQAFQSCLRRRWWLIAAITASVVGLAAVMVLRPSYVAEGKLLLSKKDRISSLTDLTDQVKEINGVGNATNPLDTEAEILKSAPLVEKTIETLNLRSAGGEPLTVDQFLRQLSVKPVRGTDILLLSYQGADPKEASAVVDSLMKYYLENNIQVNRSEAIAAREFIRNQLPDVEARVAAADAALRQFKETHRIVALEEEAKVAVEDISDLSNQITEATARLAELSSQTAKLQRQIGLAPSQAVVATSLSQSTAVQQVLAEYQKLQNELALQRTRFQPESPVIVNLEQKVSALKEQLDLRIGQVLLANEAASEQDLQLSQLKQGLAETLVKAEAERSGLANRVVVLNRAAQSYQSRASLLPQLEQTQRQLERRLQVAQVTYEQLLKRLQEVEVVENQNVGNARIVSPARVPQQRLRPRLFRLAFAGVMGLTLGVLIALVLDALDKSVKTVEEAQNLAGYPLLSVIPLVDMRGTRRGSAPGSALPLYDNPYSSICTTFEMLYTTLGFTLSDQPPKVILATSAVSGEGKSFIAANLAMAAAQMGRRVLLVDADMRCSTQHVLWQQINHKGLSDVLVDQATFSEAVKAISPTLDVLTSGTAPPNPVALLDSQRLVSLIEAATQTYDLIIFDTPALTLAPDALTLGKLVDGVLFVVRPGVVDSASVNRAKTLLTQAGQHVLGMVINGSSPERKTTNSAYTARNGQFAVPVLAGSEGNPRSLDE